MNIELEYTSKITTDDKIIEGVSTRLILPAHNNNEVKVILTSQDNHLDILNTHTASIIGEIKDSRGKIHYKFIANEAIMVNGSSKHHNNKSEHSYILEPRDIEIITPLNNKEESSRYCSIDFLINKAPLLKPFICTKLSDTGNVIRKETRGISIHIEGIGDIKCNLRSNFTENELGISEIRHQVLSVKILYCDDMTSYINAELLPVIDDLLLLSSFAQRKRITCKGWIATSENAITTYYRKYLHHADDINNEIATLIRPHMIESFLNSSYPKFKESIYKKAIERSINSLVMHQDAVLELSFLIKFQSIEAFAIQFKKTKVHEEILDSHLWSKLKKLLEKNIKEKFKDSMTSEQRRKIYNKLGELNRVSLQDTLREMISDEIILPSELWSMFDAKEKIGLATIRNVLSHGDSFPRELFSCLIPALSCLEHYLETTVMYHLKSQPFESQMPEIKPRYAYSEDECSLNANRLFLFQKGKH